MMMLARLSTCEIDCGRSGRIGGAQGLDRDACGEHVAYRHINVVGADAVNDHVRRIVDEVRIVVGAAVQEVSAGAAIEDVVAFARAQ